MSAPHLTAECACGAVAYEAVGRPIATVVCYCDDCQAAAARIEAMPGAAPFRRGDGGTPMSAYRKDRVRCVRGEPLVTGLKLRDGSPTNRRIATCCNSVMVLDFDDAKHWVDLYAARMASATPKPEALVCTKFAAEAPENPDGTPAYPGYSPSFLFKLLAARIAMLFSR
jgi:hypothetical protein